MVNASLENLTEYSTPGHPQPPVQPEQDKGDDTTPGQKRKRATAAKRKVKTPQQKETHQPPPEPTSQTRPRVPLQETPSPARILPNYSMPQFTRTRSQSPPASPTNEAQKRRKLQDTTQTTRDTAQEQNMEVDEEREHPADQGTTPSMNPGRNWDEDGTNVQGEHQATEVTADKLGEVTVEVDELANAKTLARILMIAEKTPSGGKPPAYQDPLDKYTPGPMPDIFDEDPATLLARIDQVQVHNWLALPTGKVLACPFGTDVNFRPNHDRIAKDIGAAVKEITRATTAVVAPPIKNPDISRWDKQPATFLIYNISREDEQTLLDRKVWSSNEITFQVASINIRRPTFLFTLRGFTTDNAKDVSASLAEIWGDQATTVLVKKLASDAPTQEEGHEWYMQAMDFLESATVRFLDIKSQGGKDDPHFNVYANGDLIEDDEMWLQLKQYLRNRTYKTMFIGSGRATEDFVCKICHGHDHPGGLCPFPRLPGWNTGYNARRPNNTDARSSIPPPPPNMYANNGSSYGFGNPRNRPYNPPPGRARGIAPFNRGRLRL